MLETRSNQPIQQRNQYKHIFQHFATETNEKTFMDKVITHHR